MPGLRLLAHPKFVPPCAYELWCSLIYVITSHFPRTPALFSKWIVTQYFVLSSPLNVWSKALFTVQNLLWRQNHSFTRGLSMALITIVSECATNINYVHNTFLRSSDVTSLPILQNENWSTETLMSKVSTNFGYWIWDTSVMIFQRTII